MKKLLLIIFLYTFQIGLGQDLVNELNGFKLNQFRDAPYSELKKPLQKKTFDDGFELELFLIKPDSSAYIIFEYSNQDKNSIWSIQLYGIDSELKPNFKGLKMGISKEEVIDKIGEPSSIKDIGEYGEVLEYSNTNYSLEINPNNKLSSIKIMEQFHKYFPEPNVEILPSFKTIKDILTSGNNKRISEILSPGIEIYYKDKIISFKSSWENEIETDTSGIYSLISNISKKLDKVDISNLNEYEENMRLAEGQNIKHVLKFKKHRHIKEIVMRWEFGKYLIWEIKT